MLLSTQTMRLRDDLDADKDFDDGSDEPTTASDTSGSRLLSTFSSSTSFSGFRMKSVMPAIAIDHAANKPKHWPTTRLVRLVLLGEVVARGRHDRHRPAAAARLLPRPNQPRALEP